MKKMIKNLALICILVLLIGTMIQSVYAEENIAEGTSGTCTWVIDSEGNLVIKPTTGDVGQLDNFTYAPWYNNVDVRNSIKTVKFEKTVKGNTKCSNMFYLCKNIKEIDLTNFDMSEVEIASRMFHDFTLNKITLGEKLNFVDTEARMVWQRNLA